MEESNSFRVEDKFLKSLYDATGNLYSKSNIYPTLTLTPELLLEKDYTLEYCDTITHLDGFSYLEAIFKHKSNFYIYLSKRDLSEITYNTKIYFEPSSLGEVRFFIKNLLKLKE